jgi:hypothetical protein
LFSYSQRKGKKQKFSFNKSRYNLVISQIEAIILSRELKDTYLMISFPVSLNIFGERKWEFPN